MKSSRAESFKSENQIDCAIQTTTSKTIHIVIVRTKSRPKNRPYVGMQNTICPICPVTDGTERKRPSPVKRGGPGCILSLSMRVSLGRACFRPDHILCTA